MRKKTVLTLLIAAVFVVGMIFTQATFAQVATQPGSGWSIGVPLPSPTDKITESAPVITITGKISNIGKLKGFKDFMEMTLKASEPYQSWKVWMGPEWFVVNQKVKFNVGDEVEVRGLKYRADTIIASEISKGDLTMLLRSESDGMPNWECCVPRVRR
jgi:hypothetical protein